MASRSPHSFLSVTNQGLAAIVQTAGNSDCHIVLRGSDSGPNYSRAHVEEAVNALKSVHAPLAVMVDCSHGNSQKNHLNQLKVVDDIVSQCGESGHAASRHIIGVMVESNIVAGAQKLTCGVGQKEKLTYGQSVTDACISWDDTETVLDRLASGVRARRQFHGPIGSSVAGSSDLGVIAVGSKVIDLDASKNVAKPKAEKKTDREALSPLSAEQEQKVRW